MESTNQPSRPTPLQCPEGQIEEHELLLLLGQDFSLLLYLCTLVKAQQSTFMNRRLMARIHLECALCEKLLDPFAVQDNMFWRPFRKFIAITKHFSTICLNLLQIKHIFIPRSYQPEIIEGDFPLATAMACNFAATLLQQACTNLLQQAEKIQIIFSNVPPAINPNLLKCCQQQEPAIRLTLPCNIYRNQEIDRPMIIHLATNLLHIIHENRDIIILYRNCTREEYANHLPDPLSEESLGALATHYLAQLTLYDTYIGNSNIVEQDEELKNFRGYLESIDLLLETAALLLRYIERHEKFYRDSDGQYPPELSQKILELLFEYFLLYTDRYTAAIQNYCQKLIKQYSSATKVEVPIPGYRGFHVRPSNLIARIVNHYGGDVTMEMAKEKYDASSPLALFRANEQINAIKRRAIGAIVSQNPIYRAFMKSYGNERRISTSNIRSAFFRILDSLQNSGNAMIYGSLNNITDKELEAKDGEKLLNFIKRGIAYLMATGKIDVISNINVTFVGDKRTLTDIAVLANHGYGEDQRGNNVMLPQELFYLRR